MTDLKVALVALMRGQGTYEATEAALLRLLDREPQRLHDVRRLLAAARAKGLSDDLATALERRAEGQPPGVSEGFLETVVLPPRSARRASPPGDRDTTGEAMDHAAPETGSDPDATRFPDATSRSPGPPPADDATVLTGGREHDPDATRFPGVARPESAPPSEEGSGTGSTDPSGAGATEDFLETVTFDTRAARASPGGPRQGDSAGGNEDATTVNPALRGEGDPLPESESTAPPTAPPPPACGDLTSMGGLDADRTAVIPGEIAALPLEPEDSAPAARGVASGPADPASPTRAPGAPRTGAGYDRDFRAGDRLRGRFELMSKLGEGGMGAVWKGTDLLKVEARDRNPYVAIKLLQGDFKEHPEAFVALQRETSKQQRLAHPNIATVHDFDRDDATGTVFMTMEVLEGQPIDAFIRKLPADGLPEAEAMPLVRQLCAGLSYAHNAGLVHSDLKPGNCFLTREGTIKLLDFGIARASKTKADADGETTLFDPGRLGALTPTYATIEMFEGQDPDPRDDIYALAIMTYQFLTGRHPYGRKSAPKAKELGLAPAPISKLSKRQNRGLARALAFQREDRTPSVEAFLEDLQRTKSRAPMAIGAGVAASLLIAALAYGPITRILEERQREEVIASLEGTGIDGLRAGLERARALGESQLALVLGDERTRRAFATHIARGDDASISEALALMGDHPRVWQQEIRDREEARRAIVDAYSIRVVEAFEPDQGRYDFAAANRHVDELDELFPDSATVLQIRNALRGDRDRKLGEFADRYNRLIVQGRLIPRDDEEDIGDVLAVLRAIDPEHRLLGDDRLRFRFQELAERAIADLDFQRASALLEASVDYAPEDPTLNDLRFQVRSELARIASEQRIAELEIGLQSRLPELDSLAAFQALREELMELADLSPQSPVLVRIQATLRESFGDELERLLAARDWAASEQLLVDFARLQEVPFLTEQRARLDAASAQAGHAPEMTEERRAAVQARAGEVETLLAEAELTPEWELRLRAPYNELIALLPAGDPALEEVHLATAELYLGRSRAAREGGRFSEALAYLDRGRMFHPAHEAFASEEAAIALAQEGERLSREEERRLAQVRGLEAEFRDRTAANETARAREILVELQTTLGVAPEEPFLAREAPELLAGAYERLAALQAEQGEYETALTLARAGLDLAPGRTSLQGTVADYEGEMERRERQLRLARLFDSTEPLDVEAVRADLERLQAEFPGEYPALRARFAGTRADRIRNLAQSPEAGLATVAPHLEGFGALFPEGHAELAVEVASAAQRRIRTLPAATPQQVAALSGPLAEFEQLAPGRLEELRTALGNDLADRVLGLESRDREAAAALLQAALRQIPNHRRLSGIDIELPLPRIAEARRQFESGQVTAALASLAQARRERPGHSDIPPLERAIEERKARVLEHYERYREAITRARPGHQQQLDEVYASIRRLWNDNEELRRLTVRVPRRGECSTELAGYGGQRGGTCFDVIGAGRGPELVVVPAGGGNPRPFAIGKYEVSGQEFGAFCEATGRCQPPAGSQRDLPITGVPLSLVRAYAQWLSEQASRTESARVVYRLPTVSEWEHAARAGGQQPERRFNCRVTAGGNIVAGHDLVPARSGVENGWGLTNYVGNAQEWVTSAGGVVARGGSFEDPLARCDLSISRDHDGSADGITGFRLVRELG